MSELNDVFCFESLQCADEALYDTDHTDLNSDFDEAELRRELLKDVRNAVPSFAPRTSASQIIQSSILSVPHRNGGICSINSIRKDSVKYPSKSFC